jgi:RNA polymerase sigma factor (sigma-70 family)
MSVQWDTTLGSFEEGDHIAFTILYNEFKFSIYVYCRRMLAEKEDAEDITADTFATLWDKRPHLEHVHHLKAWLYLTARNKCLQFLKQKGVRHEADNGFYRLEDEDLQVLWAELLHATQADMGLADAFRQLPMEEQKALLLKYKENLPADKAGARLGIDRDAMYNLLKKAKRRLKGILTGTGILIFIHLSAGLVYFFTYFNTLCG